MHLKPPTIFSSSMSTSSPTLAPGTTNPDPPPAPEQQPPATPTANDSNHQPSLLPIPELSLLSKLVATQFKRPNSMEKAKRIDVISRVLFPMIFAIFNMAYWSTYLMQAQAEFERTQLSS